MKSFYKINITTFLIIFQHLCIFGQKAEDRSVLERQKTETLKQIEFTQELLNSTRKSKNLTVNQLNLLNSTISGREKLITDIEEETNFLENNIELNNKRIKEIALEINKLKDEYSKIIIATYRNIQKDSYLEYILGSEDINQGYQRIKQIKYLSDYRRRVHKDLLLKQEILKDENINMAVLIKEKELALKQMEGELKTLGRERIEKQRNVSDLRAQESKLFRELKEKQNIQKRLEDEIRILVEAEIRRSRELNIAVLTPAERIISNDFVKNMGGLPWPVSRGIITGQYGEHDHPVLKGIKIKSIGIDINTIEGEKAKCIFDGEITKIVAIMGANYTVIVKHGEFRSVYQNLVNIAVKTGDKVKKGDFLGTIYTDSNNSTKLHFQLWQDKNNLDPERWLAKNN